MLRLSVCFRSRCLRQAGLAGALALATALVIGQASGGDTYPECTKPKPSKEDIEGAKGAHNAASRAYETGEYDKAIQLWKVAYEFDCTAHSELLNIANAFEKKGDRASAVTALETYLARAKTSPADAATIQERIRHMKELMTPPPSATPSVTVTAPPTATVVPSGTATPPSATVDPVTPPDGARPFGYTPLVIAGAGGAAIIAGAILLPVGIGQYNNAVQNCIVAGGDGHNNCPSDVTSAGQTARTLEGIGVTALAVGGVAAIGGLVWFFAFDKPAPTKSASIRVLPSIAPRSTGIQLDGRF